MSVRSSDYDIIIVGGGMVGASLAAALQPLPLSVAVIEAYPPSSDAQPSYDDRTTAISYGSQQIFSGMQIWSGLSENAVPIRAIHVSDQGRFGFTRITAAEQGLDALGYTLVNRTLGHVLWDFLAAPGNVDLLCPARVTACATDSEKATVTAVWEKGDERQLTARLLIAADGARSKVRELMGVSATEWDYGQTAIITNITPEYHHDCVAYERFTATGPLAVLPAADHRCAVVWTVPTAAGPGLIECSEADFLLRLHDEFGNRLGRFSRVGRRVSYPLLLTRADEQTQPRFLVTGNAAHGLHPVAAQGFNLSLRDVAVLAEIISDHESGDVGCNAILDRYRGWRREDQRKVVAFSDGLIRLFTNPMRSIRVIRNLGLLALDILPGAKREFARHTMGRAGRQTRLARGLPLR